MNPTHLPNRYLPWKEKRLSKFGHFNVHSSVSSFHVSIILVNIGGINSPYYSCSPGRKKANKNSQKTVLFLGFFWGVFSPFVWLIYPNTIGVHLPRPRSPKVRDALHLDISEHKSKLNKMREDLMEAIEQDKASFWVMFTKYIFVDLCWDGVDMCKVLAI